MFFPDNFYPKKIQQVLYSICLNLVPPYGGSVTGKGANPHDAFVWFNYRVLASDSSSSHQILDRYI